jgi:hypothetical protein
VEGEGKEAGGEGARGVQVGLEEEQEQEGDVAERAEGRRLVQ